MDKGQVCQGEKLLCVCICACLHVYVLACERQCMCVCVRERVCVCVCVCVCEWVSERQSMCTRVCMCLSLSAWFCLSEFLSVSLSVSLSLSLTHTHTYIPILSPIPYCRHCPPLMLLVCRPTHPLKLVVLVRLLSNHVSTVTASVVWPTCLWPHLLPPPTPKTHTHMPLHSLGFYTLLSEVSGLWNDMFVWTAFHWLSFSLCLQCASTRATRSVHWNLYQRVGVPAQTRWVKETHMTVHRGHGQTQKHWLIRDRDMQKDGGRIHTFWSCRTEVK